MLQYSPKIITDSLVMCLDASQNKSYPTTDLPVKGGLLLWLDAADDSTFSYSSGTSVSQWRDKSGLNNHSLQATVGNQPSRSTTQNSRKTINFDGTNDFLDGTSALTLANGYTAFTIVKSSATGERDIITSTTAAQSADIYLYQQASSGKLGNWSNVYTSNPISLNVWYLFSTNVSSVGSETLYLNGSSQTSNSRSLTNTRGYRVGAYYTGSSSGEYWSGEIAEILIFNRALSSTEMKQVHTYLGQKWGISNTDRQIFDLSGNNFNFAFNGTNPRYNAKTIVSNFDTASPFAVSSFGGQNLTSNILNLLYSDHTIEVAFNPKGLRSVYSYDNTLTTQDGQCIVLWTGRHSGLRVAQNRIYYEYWNSQSTNLGISVSISSYIDKIIYITATRTGDVLRLYINGVLASGPTTVAATTSPVSYSQINIGAAYQGNPTTQGYVWAGQHEYHLLRMYSRRLSDTEVVSNYQAFKARFDNNIVRFGLVLDLDAGNPLSYAGAGTTWYDVSGNSFNATLINSPTYSSDNGGVLNWASASSQYATVSMNSTLRVANISEEVWVYLSGTADQIFIGSQYGTSSNNSFALWIQSGTFSFGVNTGGTFYYTTSSAPSTGTWYHLVHTYNGTTQYLYINGVLTTTFNSSASGNISYDTNNTLLAIGADFNGSGYNVGPTGYVNGKMPVARIYNIALSAAQVLQNYNATKGRFGL